MTMPDKKLEGYRTIIAAIVSAVVVPVLVSKGIPVSAEMEVMISTGIMSAIMICMRLVTKVPVPWKK